MPAADEVIARLAGDRHGLVTRSLLLDGGITARAIEHRVDVGRLRVVHRGVYATGHGELTEVQRFHAAVLAGGRGAVLSHGSAAALWRILASPPGPPEVLRAGAHREGPAGIRLRRTQSLPPTDTTIHRGVPVTTPVRTLRDLAATGPAARAGLALDEARARRLVTPQQLLALTGPGSAALRRLLADAPGFTRSTAERRLRALVKRAQLPAPRANVRLHGHEVDAYWPDSGSRSRSTATRRTRPAPRSSATGNGTRSSPRAASASPGSRGGSSRRSPRRWSPGSPPAWRPPRPGGRTSAGRAPRRRAGGRPRHRRRRRSPPP